MADLKDLRNKVTVDEATMQFAGHFKTKSSVKNLLRKVGNAKLLAPIVEDSETGVYVLSDSAVQDAIMTAVVAGFDTYVAQKADWDKNKDKRPLPERVEFFRDAVMSELDKTDEVKALVVKGIESAKVGAPVVSEHIGTNGDSEEVRKAILASTLRVIMIAATEEPKAQAGPETQQQEPEKPAGEAPNADANVNARDVKTGKPIEAEVIDPNASSAAGHTPESNPKAEEPKAQAGPETQQQEPEKPAGEAPKSNKSGTKKEVVKTTTDAEKLVDDVKKLLGQDLSDVVNAERVREGILASAKVIAAKSQSTLTVDEPENTATAEWAKLMLKSMLPANHRDKLGDVTIKDAIDIGVIVVVNSIKHKCGDIPLCDANPDVVSIAVATGAFMMYSALASELSGYENVDVAIMVALDSEMEAYLKQHNGKAPKSMWATYGNLIGIRNFDKYRTAVDNAIKTADKRVGAGARELHMFGYSLGSTDAEKHLAKGLAHYKAMVA
ncbi:MAG: hypothetical protein NC548_40190 [Lachnospiraceae bacterium]|nr:hypothetical protein [Lachnospiraceae bacterium]